jgi:hypothetical protein
MSSMVAPPCHLVAVRAVPGPRPRQRDGEPVPPPGISRRSHLHCRPHRGVARPPRRPGGVAGVSRTLDPCVRIEAIPNVIEDYIPGTKSIRFADVMPTPTHTPMR